MPSQQGLLPFDATEEGRARAAEYGRKGGLTRARNAAERKAREAAEARQWNEALIAIRDTFKREELSENAAAVAHLILGKVAKGEIEISGRDVAPLLETLVTILRLEEGLSTRNDVVIRGDVSEVMARIQAVREQAARPPGMNLAEGETPSAASDWGVVEPDMLELPPLVRQGPPKDIVDSSPTDS